MTTTEIRDRLSEMCSHFTFDYNGKECGIDPIAKNKFDVWYGDDFKTISTLDEVMSIPIFGGKSIRDISNQIKIIDY